MTTPQDLLLIGRIVAPFGLQGQVKLKSDTDRPDYLIRHIRTLFIGKDRKPYILTRAFEHKPGLLILNLADVTTPDGAEDLRGAEVYIRESDAAPLGSDEYFVHQLYKLRVSTVAGEEIGQVREVMSTGASDILVVARPGQPDALIPVVREFIVELDIPGGRVVVRPIEGLL